MCLILLAWRAHPDYPAVVAANRDEFFDRPTAAAQFWKEQPAVLAGRDLKAGGTWMGITRTGRFAALTNFREPERQRPDAPSRGDLVARFLVSDRHPRDYWQALPEPAEAYNGFNLICGNIGSELWHFSNRDAGEGKKLSPGIYGISNHLLDTPWPKVAHGKSALASSLGALPDETALFRLLGDESIHDDALLPRTGVNLQWERLLSAAFVRSPSYGTRSSTIILLDRLGHVSFDEQSYLAQAQAQAAGRGRYRLTLEPNPAQRALG